MTAFASKCSLASTNLDIIMFHYTVDGKYKPVEATRDVEKCKNDIKTGKNVCMIVTETYMTKIKVTQDVKSKIDQVVTANLLNGFKNHLDTLL